MHISTFLFPLAVAVTVTAIADPQPIPAGLTPAAQYGRSLTPRQTIEDPELFCGQDFNDCGDGWCCPSAAPCAGKLYDIPVCKNPSVTTGFLQGTEPATPFKDTDKAISSLQSAMAQMTQGGLSIPSQTVGNGGDPTGTKSPQEGKATGNAAIGRFNAFGSTAGVVGAIWGLAALGGAGWVLL